ncbi:MAG: hypothetical protein M1832_004507 [Thelocarpon impressellum]|nr:MAG: hypothetical protein M1832_004507 [Thelocarpon impressellum]
MALSPAAFANVTYDYVIAGGGTAGLVMAARLTEDRDVSVAVIEAGEDRSSDPAVLIPGLAATQLGDPKYDWDFRSVPQPNMANRKMGMTRGKQLGGSSANNFLYWTHASRADIDDWGKLGNSGWTWDELVPYFQKSESYVSPPAKTAEDLGIDYIDLAAHGKTGPIKNGFYNQYGEFEKAWWKTYGGLGLDVDGDPISGKALGGYTNLINIDPLKVERSYAANAYYNPNKERKNLHLLTGALVSNIVFADKNEEKKNKRPHVATGVNFTVAGQSYVVKAKKEVILSAGALQSPQILELSGIGDKSLLESKGIESLIDNKNVGENFQDHAYVTLGFAVQDGLFTSDQFSRPGVVEEALELYKLNRTGRLAGGITASALLSYEQIKDKNGRGEDEGVPNTYELCRGERCDKSGLKEQYELTKKKLDDPKEASVQELYNTIFVNPALADQTKKLFGNPEAPGGYFFMGGVVEHPFSRGSVHIGSADPSAAPVIDPNYLSHPLDVQLYNDIALHLQKVARSQPLASLLKGNGTVFQPGFQELNRGNVKGEVAKNLLTEYHYLGTCSMLPKKKGGVVDEKLKVYETANLRIVDASVFPMQVRANIQSLVYAAAEKAADIIKKGAGKGKSRRTMQ